MKLPEFLPWANENKENVKLHCAIGEHIKREPLQELAKGRFKRWQEGQNRPNFERDYILSLVYYRPGEWVFGGVYKSKGHSGEQIRSNGKKGYVYDTATVDVAPSLVGRAVFSFQKNFRNSYLLLENQIDKIELLEVLREPYRVEEFPGFERACVSFDQLQEIVSVEEPTWRAALSSVVGVYAITDRSNGKIYIGSAYGNEAIWTRWSSYAANGHGGNRELREIIDDNGFDYAKN